MSSFSFSSLPLLSTSPSALPSAQPTARRHVPPSSSCSKSLSQSLEQLLPRNWLWLDRCALFSKQALNGRPYYGCLSQQQWSTQVNKQARARIYALLVVCILCLLSLPAKASKLFYKEFYLSEGCQPEPKQIILQLLPDDANCALIIRSAPISRECQPLPPSCSIWLMAPPGFGLVITPARVRIEHNVAQLRLHQLQILNASEPAVLTWYEWPSRRTQDNSLLVDIAQNANDASLSSSADKQLETAQKWQKVQPDSRLVKLSNDAVNAAAEFDMPEYVHDDEDENAGNQSTSKTIFSASGQTQFLLSIASFQKASTWQSFDLQLVITLVAPVNREQLCPNRWFWNCGSRMCIRQSLVCDGVKNCNNGHDEQNCGLGTGEILLLAFFLLLVIIFMLVVFYVYIRLLRRQHTSGVPKIKINSIEEKSESQSV